jgi:DNA-binding NarL/FixJ family response regulator
VLDPKVVEGLLERRICEAKSPLAGLTERELRVLQEMATGKNNAAIARALFLSERAVEKHINALFSKLGLSGGEGHVPAGHACLPGRGALAVDVLNAS